jgi:subtilisin family serine protease
VIGITVCAAVAALGLATAGAGGVKARSLATRTPTAAELSAAAAAGVAQRWEREPAADMFPATFGYTTDLQTKEHGTRLAIGSGRDCAAALDATLRGLAARDGCAAGMRATYTDALGGTVYTVGVLAFPNATDAASFYNRVPINPFPGNGLHALAVAGTPAARFTDAARQALAAQQAGPYVVLAVAGYADGRPAAASGERRDAVFDPAGNLVAAVAAPLAKPVTVRCGAAEWACTLAAQAPPTSVDGIRPYEMSMLGQIGVPAAWNVSRGSGVKVAVLDSGVGAGAPDLSGVVTNGPDYTIGADPPGYQPPHEHGTYIASIIAGRGTGPGDSQGVIGVAPESHILSVRVILDDSEPGLQAYESKPAYANAIGKGIYYAVAHGAKVINMSLGSGQPTAELRSAVAHAISKGVVVVASAGNDGSRSGFAPYIYPASFSGVIAVAAVTSGGSRASFSEQNASVVLSAPGGDWVMGDQPDQSWVAAEGTSPAAAVVSGVAALIKSRYPSLSPALVEQALVTSVEHRPSGGYDVYTGFGEINASGALAAAARLAAGHPAAGLPVTARFAAAPGPIQVTRKDAAGVVAYGAVGGGGLVIAIAALWVMVVLARRRPSRPLGAAQPAGAFPDTSQWTPEPWTFETWRGDNPSGSPAPSGPPAPPPPGWTQPPGPQPPGWTQPPGQQPPRWQ